MLHRLMFHYTGILILVILFTACTPTPPAPNATVAPDGVAPITITFAAESVQEAEFEPLIARFNAEQPTVQVQFVPLEGAPPLATVVQQADTALVPGVNPQDVGLVTDLRPLLDADATMQIDDFFPAIRPASGALPLLPRTVSVPLLAYNRDLFQQRTVSPPTPDTTWADVLTAAEQMARNSGTPDATYGLLNLDDGSPSLGALLTEAGVNLRDTTAFDTPQVRTGLTRLQQLAQSGALYLPMLTANGADSGQLSAAIRRGQIAMWPVEEGLPPQDGTTTLPFAMGVVRDPRRQPWVQDGFIISQGTAHRDAAWRWLSFLSQQSLARQQGRLPARASQAQAALEQLTADQRSVLQTALASVPTQQTWDMATWAALSAATTAVVRDKQPLDAVIQAAAQARQQTANAPQPTAAAIAVATPQPTVKSDTQVITFSDEWFDRPTLTKLVAQFEQEYPDIDVRLRTHEVKEGEFTTAATLAAEADCFLWGDADATNALDLRPFMDADATFSKDDYPRALLSPHTDGGIYSLPYTLAFPMLMANKVLLDQAGIPVPTEPVEVRDVIALAERLHRPDATPPQYGFFGKTEYMLSTFAFAKGMVTITGTTDQRIPDLMNPSLIAGVKDYLTLMQFNPTPGLVGTGQTNTFPFDYDQPLREGQVGVWFTMSWGDIPQTAQLEPVILPFAPATGRGEGLGGRGLQISNRARNPQACWHFIRFLNEQVRLDGDAFPARRSLAESAAFLRTAPLGSQAAYTAYQPILDAPPVAWTQPTWYGVWQLDGFWLLQAIDRASRGANLEQELAKAQDVTERFKVCMDQGGKHGQCARQVDPDYAGWWPLEE